MIFYLSRICHTEYQLKTKNKTGLERRNLTEGAIEHVYQREKLFQRTDCCDREGEENKIISDLSCNSREKEKAMCVLSKGR